MNPFIVPSESSIFTSVENTQTPIPSSSRRRMITRNIQPVDCACCAGRGCGYCC